MESSAAVDWPLFLGAILHRGLEHNPRQVKLLLRRQKEASWDEWKIKMVEKGFNCLVQVRLPVDAGRGNWHVWWVWLASSRLGYAPLWLMQV